MAKHALTETRWPDGGRAACEKSEVSEKSHQECPLSRLSRLSRTHLGQPTSTPVNAGWSTAPASSGCCTR
jgi:hypothetical protein